MSKRAPERELSDHTIFQGRRITGYLTDGPVNEGKRKEVSARGKLKALIRKVVDTSCWLTPMLQQAREPPQLTKDSWFSLEEKLRMLGREEDRSEQLIETITKKLFRIPGFMDFNMDLLRELVRTARFLAFGGNRTLFQAGRDPLAAYLVLEGSVCLYDPNPRKPLWNQDDPLVDPKQKLECRMQKDVLGDEEIIRGQSRRRTAFTQGPVELLYFEKEHILRILRPTVMKDWENKFNDLRKFRMFRYYETEMLREVAKLAKYINVRPRKYIKLKMDGEGNPEKVYLLLVGTCQVIQRLLVARDEEQEGFSKFKLYYWQDAEIYPAWVESVYMRVCYLHSGAFFGIGERMSKQHILTESSCRFLTLPGKVVRHLRHKLHVFDELLELLDELFPSTIELFLIFVYGRLWHQFSRKTVRNCNRLESNSNTIHDAPLTVRAAHLKLRGQTLERIIEEQDYMRGRDLYDTVKLLKDRQKQRNQLSDMREHFFAKYKAPYVQESFLP